MKIVKFISIILIETILSVACYDKKTEYQNRESLDEIEGVCENDSMVNEMRTIENANVFLDIDYYGEIAVYNHPQGTVIYKIKNDSIQEEYVLFDLIDKNDSMFFVEAYSSLSNNMTTKGWIKKSSHLGIFSSVYQGSMVLYKEPDKKSLAIKNDKQYCPDMYEVVDFKDNWLKIIVKDNGRSIEGWMPPEEQCCNVYSTCN